MNSMNASNPKPIASMTVRELNLPNPWKFFDPNSPWVLVEEGSLLGFFDFVPRHLRVGPWTTVAPIFLAVIVAKLVYWMPHQSSFYLDEDILSTHPLEWGVFWLYNLTAFFWMKFILVKTLRLRGPGVVLTYTIQSWIMITIRHGLSALAPFLPRKNFLLWINELLRFPALATASITFVFWNFCIAPAIWYNMNPERRRGFVKFNFNFRMVQLHFFNIFFAIMNALVASSREFQYVDLWCALAGAVGYASVYLLVLDRIGVHLVRTGYFSHHKLFDFASYTHRATCSILCFLRVLFGPH
ncbi:hypothetical protein ACHAWF_017241 [Thalassiosira exigua]